MDTNPIDKKEIIHLKDDYSKPALCGSTDLYQILEDGTEVCWDYPASWVLGMRRQENEHWDDTTQEQEEYMERERPNVCPICLELLPVWLLAQ